MKKCIITLLIIVFAVSVSAQTKEEVVKAVLSSFKQKNTNFLRYFIKTENQMEMLKKETSFTSIDSAVRLGITSWEELSLKANFDSTASSKHEFVAMMRDAAKKQVISDWQTLIKRHWPCYGNATDTSNVSLVREMGYSQESFFAVSLGRNKFAIRLDLQKDGDKYWIVDISSTIRLPDTKGKFTCHAQCINGKGSAFTCL